jgi:membrane protease YdiL (CAAX protease family)
VTNGSSTPDQQMPDLQGPSGQSAPEVPFFQRIPPVPFALLSLALIFFLYQFVAGGITLLLSRGKITQENVQLMRWATILGEVIFILVPTLVLARLRGLHIVRDFRLHIPEYREIIATVVGVFSLQQVIQGYMMVQDAVPLPSKIQQYVDYFKKLLEETYKLLVDSHSPSEFLFVVLVVALVPAVAEELLFRGLIQRSLEEAAGGLRGAIMAGVIFGAYHLNPFSLIPLAGLGVYFGFIVYRSQNISLGISAHFFNNFVACVAAYLQLSDDFVALAPGRTPSTLLAVLNFVVFGMVFVIATYYFIRVTERAPDIGE